MPVTINITFEKKHFLALGIIITFSFFFMAITNILAANPPSGQYHPLSEFFVDSSLDMQGMNLTNVDVVKAAKYCDENGMNCGGGGLSNCELVTVTDVDAGWSPGVHSATASCPGIKKVTGGGCTFQNIYDADAGAKGYVFENRPLNDRSGWYCRTHTYLFPIATRISYAICCNE